MDNTSNSGTDPFVQNINLNCCHNDDLEPTYTIEKINVGGHEDIDYNDSFGEESWIDQNYKFKGNNSIQENQIRISRTFTKFEGKVNSYLQRYMNDNVYCRARNFIGIYNGFINGLQVESPLLKLKLDELNTQVGKLERELELYGNGLDPNGNILDISEKQTIKSSPTLQPLQHIAQNTVLQPLYHIEKQQTTPLIQTTLEADDKTKLVPNNYWDFPKSGNPKEQLEWFSREFNREIAGFGASYSSATKLIGNYLDFHKKNAYNLALFDDFIIVNNKMNMLVGLFNPDISIIGIDNKTEAENKIRMLIARIEDCRRCVSCNSYYVSKINFLIAQYLSKKWKIKLDEYQLLNKIQYIEDEYKINDCKGTMQWFINEFDAVMNNTTRNVFVSLKGSYESFILTMPKSEELALLHNIAVDKMNQIISNQTKTRL